MSTQHRVLASQLPLGFGETVPVPFPTTTAAFYHHAASCPDALAIRDLSSGLAREITYGQLAARAQQLASRLRAQGVASGQRVPLVVKRSLEMIIGIWAILSCGAQYVPLDGGVVPDETIRRVVSQAQSPAMLCLAATKHRLAAFQSSHELIAIDEALGQTYHDFTRESCVDLSTADGGCYVIYTSGTTGEPKGVDVTHKNVANLVCLFPGNLGVGPGVSVGQLLNISFDMAAWEIFTPLCNGGTLVLRGSDWGKALEQIDVLICTPTILSKYLPQDYPRIKTVATAGEPTTRMLADRWATHGTYWNCCGPTETTIVNTMQKHIVGDELSIGRPTPNNRVYILGPDGEHVTVGSPGVMWAGGLGVSRGYIGLLSKTEEKYQLDRFANDGSKMYDTGDLGRWRPDGSIEILGRTDDQVKVKGFRVELDGVSASLASAPSVSRATVLMIDGEMHGFVAPSTCEEAVVKGHVKKYQPYYAVPSRIHVVDDLPMTPNGKINKQELRAMAITVTETAVAMELFDEKQMVKTVTTTTVLKTQASSSTLSTSLSSTTLEKPDLTQELPDKLSDKPFRNLRYRIFIVYRTLFSFVGLLNLAAIISVFALDLGSKWLGTITAINLAATVLVRQDSVINLLYTVTCSMPKSLPLGVRRRLAKVYHLGGAHSGAGVCATAWLVASTIYSTVCRELGCSSEAPASIATQVVSWLLCSLLCSMVASAWPSIRKKHHDLFERSHRFMGWTALGLFWVRTVLAAHDSIRGDNSTTLGLKLAHTADFWLLLVASCSIASSWFFLRKVPVDAEVLSDHAVRLHFDYTVPVNGSFTRISNRPLLEWHSFATIPSPEASGDRPPGYSLVVSRAGDWTRACIEKPPTSIWVRGLPTCGVMRIATLFNRVVLVGTGSGIGPLLGHINQQSCPTQLIWSASLPEKTFGKEIVQAVRDKVPDAIIHDTRSQGRPDLVKMSYNLVQSFRAEAVIIIANEKITKKVVYGLETRGIPAFGAIWDS